MAWSVSTGKKKLLLLVAITMILLQHNAATDGSGNGSVARPGCQDKCGNVSIAYPFGIGNKSCFREGFEVRCVDNVPILNSSDTSLLEINVPFGEARVMSPVSWYCNFTNGTSVDNPSDTTFEVDPFTISKTKNKFTAIGCATIAFIAGKNNHSYISGCISSCDEDGIDSSKECTGMGCCQIPIPDDLSIFQVEFSSDLFENGNTGVQNFSPCSYGFIVDKDWYNFDRSYAKQSYFLDHYGDGVPLVLEWVVDNKTCVDAKSNLSSYACLDMNSVCHDVSSGLGPGYLCNCSQGYEGNPYLEGGCQDINECDYPSSYPCNGKCKNTIGSYTCSCPPGTRSEDPKNASCRPNDSMIIGLAISLIFIIIACIFAAMTRFEKRKLAKEKERFFKQNGGQILYQQILSKQLDTVIIFTVEDLKKATNNFDKSRELGTGGHGAVYKGILSDKVVAVKRSTIINVSQTEEFVQEIIILSQINHRNVVRLLGCCLEVEVPILVYEFVPNGTLFHLIHGNIHRPVSLEVRLRIAQQSAEALAYMHLSINHPIVHGDVKSLNILLDDKYMAKVTDFGASRMLPEDEVQLMTIVQGTLGYLDPEYLQERKLTEKSDVYSFGVVLLELITRKKAIYSEGTDHRKSLAACFLEAMKENRVGGLLDPSIMCVGKEELLQEVAELGRQCLSVKGEERPSMSQVADTLKAIRSTWRELLLLKHKETELVIENSGAGLDCRLPPSMNWTARMMGLEVETPVANNGNTIRMV